MGLTTPQMSVPFALWDPWHDASCRMFSMKGKGWAPLLKQYLLEPRSPLDPASHWHF
jgi:hypothetical protein